MEEEVVRAGAGLEHDVDVREIAGQDERQGVPRGRTGPAARASAQPASEWLTLSIDRAASRPLRRARAQLTTGRPAFLHARMPPGTFRTSSNPARCSTLATAVER